MRILLRNKIPFFSHLTVSWSLPVARIIFLKSSQIQSGGFTNLLCKIVKCLERIKSALQRKRSGILLSPATNLLSVRFHIVDKYLHSLIILKTSFQISRGFLLSDWNLEWFAGPSEMFPRTCDVRHVGILVHCFYTELGQVSKKMALFSFPLSFALGL